MAKNEENTYLDIGSTGGTTWSVPFDQDFCDSLTGSYPSIKYKRVLIVFFVLKTKIRIFQVLFLEKYSTHIDIENTIQWMQ